MATAEKPIWFQSSREQLDALLLEVCDGLQLRPSRHELAVERYGTVNEILEKAGSPFRFLRPRIFPQGSMALGTTCKPVEGPHDLDFVLQIDAPHWRWHPLAGLSALYECLSSNETYRKMISLKNRVVRLTYADEFYMDILPAYTDLSSGGTCILVPDRARVSLCPSNPEGFILWFRNRCLPRTRRVMEKAKPVPAQEAVHEKEPLQLAVQLLKRWRDLAFAEECRAPISVVLTTLAGMYYAGEESVSEALTTILAGIVNAIALEDLQGKRIVVRNPSNLLEDFGKVTGISDHDSLTLQILERDCIDDAGQNRRQRLADRFFSGVIHACQRRENNGNRRAALLSKCEIPPALQQLHRKLQRFLFVNSLLRRNGLRLFHHPPGARQASVAKPQDETLRIAGT